MQRGRKPNDGRGRLGGRQKGAENRTAVRDMLLSISKEYFERKIEAEDIPLDFFCDIRKPEDEEKALYLKAEFVVNHKDELFSQFDIDVTKMKPNDRAKAMVELLPYHTAKMQAIVADMTVKDANLTLTERLLKLANGESIDDNDEQ